MGKEQDEHRTWANWETKIETHLAERGINIFDDDICSGTLTHSHTECASWRVMNLICSMLFHDYHHVGPVVFS